jgi:arylsulfatase
MLGTTIETAGYPEVYNIEADPKEKVNVVIQNGWLVVPYLQIINEYLASLVEYPNSPAPTLTDFRRATR